MANEPVAAPPATPPAGAPPAPVTGAEWINEVNWTDPKVKESPSLAKFKGKTVAEVVPTLVQSYLHAESELGKRIALPDEKNPESVKAFREKLGVPKAPAEYTITAPTFPEGSGLEMDKPTLDGIRAFAHEQGFTVKQTQAIVDRMAKGLVEGTAEQRMDRAQAEAATETALKERWGAAFEMNKSYAARAFEQFAPQSLKDAIGSDEALARAFGNNTDFAIMMASIGRALGEQSLIVGDPTKGPSLQDLEAEKNKIMANDSPFWGGPKADPAEQKRLTARLLEINQILTGGA